MKSQKFHEFINVLKIFYQRTDIYFYQREFELLKDYLQCQLNYFLKKYFIIYFYIKINNYYA